MTQEIKTHGLTFTLDGEIIHLKSIHDGGYEEDILPGDRDYKHLRGLFVRETPHLAWLQKNLEASSEPFANFLAQFTTQTHIRLDRRPDVEFDHNNIHHRWWQDGNTLIGWCEITNEETERSYFIGWSIPTSAIDSKKGKQ